MSIFDFDWNGDGKHTIEDDIMTAGLLGFLSDEQDDEDDDRDDLFGED